MEFPWRRAYIMEAYMRLLGAAGGRGEGQPSQHPKKRAWEAHFKEEKAATLGDYKGS